MIWYGRRAFSLVQRRYLNTRPLSTQPPPESRPDISLSEACRQRLESIRTTRKADRILLRLSVTSGGCEGFSYSFSFIDPPTTEADDHVFGPDKAQVVIDQSSLDLVKGSTIDFTQEMIRSAFIVSGNPNSESSCGCGSSFSPKI